MKISLLGSNLDMKIVDKFFLKNLLMGGWRNSGVAVLA